MRRYPFVLATILLTAVGCGSTSESAGSPAVPNSAAPASPLPAESTGSSAMTNSARPTSPSPSATRGDPDNPQDLAGAPVVLTGRVSIGSTCAVLTTRGQRWALIGAAAGTLNDGQIATVRGRPTAVPPGCHADFGLAVRSVN